MESVFSVTFHLCTGKWLMRALHSFLYFTLIEIITLKFCLCNCIISRLDLQNHALILKVLFIIKNNLPIKLAFVYCRLLSFKWFLNIRNVTIEKCMLKFYNPYAAEKLTKILLTKHETKNEMWALKKMGFDLFDSEELEFQMIKYYIKVGLRNDFLDIVFWDIIYANSGTSLILAGSDLLQYKLY